MNMYEYVMTPESVLAYRQLLALSLESWKPEVAAWMHGEEAAPVLAQLLLHVPCPPTLH